MQDETSAVVHIASKVTTKVYAVKKDDSLQ